MAADASVQGTGIGGCCRGRRCQCVLAAGAPSSCRPTPVTAALRFYRVLHGFDVEDEGFLTADTQLPHHRISVAVVAQQRRAGARSSA